MDTKQKILEIFIETLGVGIEEIEPETTNHKLGMDSLDKLDIVGSIEAEFNIEISDAEFGELKTFKDYVGVVERKIA